MDRIYICVINGGSNTSFMPSTREDKCHTAQTSCVTKVPVYGLAVLALQALGRLHVLTKTESR